jgi:uncharacterized protein YkwD
MKPMPWTPPATPSRRFFIVLVLVTSLAYGVVAGAAAPAAQANDRTRMLALINTARRHHGEHRLQLSLSVSHMAKRHSRRMAKINTLFHTSNLGGKLKHWSVWGENVGYGWGVHQVFMAWMNSAEHRANILKKKFRHIGIGLYWKGGSLWATADFWG